MRADHLLKEPTPPILAALKCIDEAGYEELVDTLRAREAGFFNPDLGEFRHSTTWQTLLDEEGIFIPQGFLRIPSCDDLEQHLIMREIVNLMHAISDADESKLRSYVFADVNSERILINHCSKLSSSFFGEGEHSERVLQCLDMRGWAMTPTATVGMSRLYSERSKREAA